MKKPYTKYLCQRLTISNKLSFKFCLYFLIFNCLIFSCKNNIYNEFKPLDGGTWNIMAIKTYDKYLVGSDKYEVVHGNYLYTDFKHKKVLFEIENKEIQGDFLIKKNDENYKFVLSNTSDSLFNNEYDVTLKIISKSSFSTHYSLILRSDNLLIAAKKIQMGNGSE